MKIDMHNRNINGKPINNNNEIDNCLSMWQTLAIFGFRSNISNIHTVLRVKRPVAQYPIGGTGSEQALLSVQRRELSAWLTTPSSSFN